MSRVLLQYLVPLLLPTLVYLLWWGTIGRRRANASGGGTTLAQGPWFWLILAGGILLAAVLAYTAFVSGVSTGADTDKQYVAPHLEDGRVVPGHFEGRQ